jgi:phosphate transport system permease protein
MATSTDTPPPPVGARDRPVSLHGKSGARGDVLFSGLARLAGLSVVVMVVLVGLFLVVQAAPALRANTANFFTSRLFKVDAQPFQFGIADLLWATVMSSLVAVLIAVPLGVSIALFLSHYAPSRLARPAGELVALLAAVPSIIYGLWAAQLVGPYFEPVQTFLQHVLGWIPLFAKTSVSGSSTVLFAGVVLGIMILPIITSLSKEVFVQTPRTQQEGAIALGATRWEMIRTTVLPFGKSGVISAAMLGLGRALGETIAVTIIVSSLSNEARQHFSLSLFNGGETFASRIANNAAEFDTPLKAGAYISAGLVLFALTFFVNAIARIVIQRQGAFSE